LLLTARELKWIALATVAEPEPVEQVARVAKRIGGRTLVNDACGERDVVKPAISIEP
jgi:hypothetical protein